MDQKSVSDICIDLKDLSIVDVKWQVAFIEACKLLAKLCYEMEIAGVLRINIKPTHEMVNRLQQTLTLCKIIFQATRRFCLEIKHAWNDSNWFNSEVLTYLQADISKRFPLVAPIVIFETGLKVKAFEAALFEEEEDDDDSDSFGSLANEFRIDKITYLWANIDQMLKPYIAKQQLLNLAEFWHDAPACANFDCTDVFWYHIGWPNISSSKNMIDREEKNELLVKIKLLLNSETSCVLIVHGDEGVGKTTMMSSLLKTRIADISRGMNDSHLTMVWVNVCHATNRDNFRESQFVNEMYSVLNKIGILQSERDISTELISAKLERSNQKYLFILDDVCNIGAVRVMSKLGRNVRVIAISRKRRKAFYENSWFHCDSYEVKRMSELSIRSILFTNSDVGVMLRETQMNRLVKLCNGIPLIADILKSKLAIENQIGIEEFEKNVSEILQTFEDAKPGQPLLKPYSLDATAIVSYPPKPILPTDSVYHAFLLFSPGQPIASIDLQMLWDFDDDDMVRLRCRLALVHHTADNDGCYLLHEDLYRLTAQRFKEAFKIENDQKMKSHIARDLIESSHNILMTAVQFRRHLLIRTILSHCDFKTIGKMCLQHDMLPLKLLVENIFMDQPDLMVNSDDFSESTELLCHLVETTLKTCFADNVIEKLTAEIEEIRKCAIKAGLTGFASSWNRRLLFAAIKFKCDEMVLELLESATAVPAVNAQDPDGNNALIFASMNAASVPIISKLATLIDDVNAQNKRGETALWHCATCTLAEEMAEAIFDKSNSRVDFNIKDHVMGLSALHVAIVHDKFELVSELLEKQQQQEEGSELPITQHHPYMPKLYYDQALRTTSDALKRLLLERKEELLSRDEATCSIHMAIVPYQDVSEADKADWAPLHSASQKGILIEVESLLAKGADIDLLTNDGWTALLLASYNGLIEVVDLLLLKGANLDLQNTDGMTAAMAAAQKGHLDIVKLLVENNCSIDSSDCDGWNVLHVAAFNGHLAIVQYLVEQRRHELDVDMQDHDGWTALHLACQAGHMEIVKLLLDGGANIEIANVYGKTALNVAAENGHHDIVQLLLARGADHGKLSKAIALPDHMEIANLAIEKMPAKTSHSQLMLDGSITEIALKENATMISTDSNITEPSVKIRRLSTAHLRGLRMKNSVEHHRL